MLAVALVLPIVSLTSCSKHDASLPSVLTVKVSDSYLRNQVTDMWIFISDRSGKTLDIHQIKAADTYNFVSGPSADDSLNMTTLVYYIGPSLAFTLNTYSVRRGNSFSFDIPPKPDITSATGTARVRVTNFPANPNPVYDNIYFSDGFQGGSAYSRGSGADSVILNLHADTSSVLISSLNASNAPIYAWIHGVKNGSVPTKDISSFSLFPKTIPLPLSGNIFGQLKGFYSFDSQPASGGYVLDEFWIDASTNGGNLPAIGYFEGFDSYALAVGHEYTDPESHLAVGSYYKRGALNTNFMLPTIEFAAMSRAFQNPGFTFLSGYTFKANNWSYFQSNVNSYDVSVSWTLYSGNTAVIPRISEIPDALLTKYPMLDLTKLTYYNSVYYDYRGGYTYVQYLQDSFAGTLPILSEVYQYRYFDN